MRTIAWITSKNEQFDIKDIEARKTKLNIKDLPEGLSGFKNDMGFIDRTVSNLLNYYTKNETYNREKINELVSARLLIRIVDKLPTSDISTSTIYFLKRKKEQGTTQYESDVYDEYIYVDGTWELIGNTYVDLTNYYTKSETESKINEKVAIETQNRTLADNTLQNNIDIVQTNVDNVNNSLNSEIVTRQNKDLNHESKMSEIETNLNSETVRATNAENNLSDRCDSYDSHVANKSNPHNVTKVQVGLGNVTNVSTTSTITSGSSNNITSGAVYTALSNKVDKVDGKGLSDQNFTYEEKVKLSGLSNYNDTSLSNRVSATESAITKLNANSSTSGSVDYKIAKALEKVTSISFEIVSSLPATGVAGKIYFVKGTGSEATNTYTEYVWLGSNFERIGESVVKVDLSDIYTKSQVNALVSVKNDKITIEENYNLVLTDEHTFTSIPAGKNPTTGYTRKLSQVWNYIKGKADSVYAKLSHTHDKSEITNFAHNHDVMYYRKSEIDTKLSDKSDTGHTHDYLPLSGGAMTGNIKYKGSQNTYDMIKFIDNTDDAYGDGIAIGGGGLTIIGGGESADVVAAQQTSGGNEKMIIANDTAIDFYTNTQSGFSSAKHITMNTDGTITADGFNGKASTADKANGIVPKYTKKTLTTVSATTTKYIKLADCMWNQEGTMKVYLYGENFEDTLVINFGGGNGLFPMLCGYYTTNNNNINSVIAQKGSSWNKDYSIWIKIRQLTTCIVNVAVLTGSCTVNISETTTAPTNIINWDINRGYWGTFTGSLNGNATSATTATNLKVSNDDNTSSNCYLIWTNGVGDGSTARGTYTSRDLTYCPNSHRLISEYISCNGISGGKGSFNQILVIPTSAPSQLVDGSIWLA